MQVYFKQGAYSQTNGKDYETNKVWAAGIETYEGNILKQYEIAIIRRQGLYMLPWAEGI